jgi:hypothetical protein
MHQLGDQWIEIIDGERHMVKAVEGKYCQGCMYSSGSKFCDAVFWRCMREGEKCPFNDDNLIVKDLGILNKDGCLPNGWGEYPHVEGVRDTKTWVVWYRCVTRMGVYCTTDSYKTKEEAIDAWNRRE